MEQETKRGPGRPRKGEKKKITTTISLSPEVMRALEHATMNSSEFIEKLLRKELGLNYN